MPFLHIVTVDAGETELKRAKDRSCSTGDSNSDLTPIKPLEPGELLQLHLDLM